ncbi:MAG: DUF211 domain-containing protein [Candidatus Thorarchaeota archaeon]
MAKIEFDLDVLKPHLPSNFELAKALKSLPGILYVSIKTEEIDNVTTSVTINIRGNDDLELESIQECLEDMNCALHSVDRVIIDNEN